MGSHNLLTTKITCDCFTNMTLWYTCGSLQLLAFLCIILKCIYLHYAVLLFTLTVH